MTRRCQWAAVVLILLTAAAAQAADSEVSPVKPSSQQWEGQQVPLDEGALLTQSFLDDLSVYEPIYFLFGVDPGLEESKFQLSLKYRLFNPGGWMAAKAAWLSGFHLGYTQRSIWDLAANSKPFDDTSYMPELFYLLPKIELNSARISAFGIQGGFQHESNGKGGEDSRSTNYLYLKPVMAIHLAGDYHLKIAPKVFTYINNDDDTNKDLEDYRGYVDLEVAIVDPEGVALKSHLWWADEGGSLQLDLTYPMTRLLGKSLNFYLHAQYFSGYAETLLHYDQRQDVFRLGFSIVR
jgi:outer membrane phospholipase A